MFHLTFKPRGQVEVFRRLDPKLTVNPWQAFGSTDIRYATNVTNAIWRGEIMIPWEHCCRRARQASDRWFCE